MDDLDYDKHLESFKHLYGFYADTRCDKKGILKLAEEEAKYLHALSVFNPLRDWIQKTIQIAEGLQNRNGRYYMMHGAGRRFQMLFRAYQQITAIAYGKRSEPLSSDEQISLSQAINITYINLRGILDNFAWCLLYERNPEAEEVIPRERVGLFAKDFRQKCSAYSYIAKEIETHDGWHKDMKERRDPVAHRIPLYVPPSIVTEEEAATYSTTYDRFKLNLNSLKIDKADAALNQLDSIGTFFPYFIHHPEESPIPIYPTIPSDMSHLMRIGDAVANCLLGKSGQNS